jgi:hypothetical protein
LKEKEKKDIISSFINSQRQIDILEYQIRQIETQQKDVQRLNRLMEIYNLNIL